MIPVDTGRVQSDLERLVAFDTQNPPGREREAARFVLGELLAMGCRAETVEIADGRTNVAAIFANGPGPVFAFNTHIDVVPAGGGWTADPFRLRQADGRLYGRGACDAKGPLAAMLEAMRRLIAARQTWSGTLLGVFVCDEEVGSIGARAYAKTAGSVDFCAIGEPTSCTAVTAHKGSVRPIVRVHGVSAHSGMPDLGVNAVLKSVPLLKAVIAEHDRVRTISHDLVGAASLTIVGVSGGVADNVVPDACDFVLDRRMVPGEDEAIVLKDLQTMIDAAARDAGTKAEIIGYKPTTGAASETRADHPIVAAAQSACLTHNGRHTPIGGFQGGCDLVHFRSLGARGVVIGAGSLEVAHKPDEFVPVDELLRSVHIYRDLAHAMFRSERTQHAKT